MKRTCVLVFAALVGAASCGRKLAVPKEPPPPTSADEGGGAAPTGADKKKKEGVGLKDFIDYATGAGPIRHGKRMKKQILKTAAEHNRQLEEVMGK